MVSLSWDYVRAEIAETCARLLAEGATPQQLRTIITGRAEAMLIDECGREHAAIVLRCMANEIEEPSQDHRADEEAAAPSFIVIEGGGGSKV